MCRSTIPAAAVRSDCLDLAPTDITPRDYDVWVFHPDGPTLAELAEQALSSTERGYDLLAPKFDHTPFRTPDVLLDVVPRVVGEVDRALDVCCGTGAAMRVLRPICRVEIAGIDMSQGMLDEAARRLADAPGAAALRLIRGDAVHMDFDAEFDLAVSFGAFGHVVDGDEESFVDSVRRALLPGGRFVFATSRRPNWLSPARWAAEGFNLVMRARNLARSPPFIMYYLTFMWPEVEALLRRHGFAVAVRREVFPEPFGRALLVIATKT